jgi:hypothetical protein
MIALAGKKLGVLLSAAPQHPNFTHCLRLVEAALERGVDVYLYCIDEAVIGVGLPPVQSMRERGLKLFACAYSCQRRNLPVTENATYSGLSMVSDIIAGTDRFLSFN